MSSTGQFSGAALAELVGRIYAGAVDPQLTSEVLEHVNDQLGACCTRLLLCDPATQDVLQASVSVSVSGSGLGSASSVNAAHHAYLAQWCRYDPVKELALRQAPGCVLRCHDHFDDGFVASSPFFQEHLLAQGLRWTLCGLFDGDRHGRGIVASLRGVEDPPFEVEAIALLRLLLPHFNRAAKLRASVPDQQPVSGGSLGLLRALPTPWMLTDHAGRCVEANEPFQSLVDVIGFQFVLGRFRMTSSQAHDTWERALFETHATALGRTAALGPSADGAGEWAAHFIPWGSLCANPAGPEGRMILVVFERRAVGAAADSRLLALKGRLTRAELEVFAAMLQGSSAKVIAKQRGASFHTIRSQIVRILEKTGHRSQRELIASFGVSVLPDSVVDSA